MAGITTLSQDRTTVLTDCPECKRTIWVNTVCNHGTVPAPSKDFPQEMPGSQRAEVKRGNFSRKLRDH